MPILVKGDDIRNGTKAKASHSWLKAAQDYRSQWVKHNFTLKETKQLLYVNLILFSPTIEYFTIIVLTAMQQ